jgi:hypothetical protein
MTTFLEKLDQIQSETQSDLILVLRPEVMLMPLSVRIYDDPFFPFGKAIIQATRDLVVGYQFDFASYLRLGAAGAIALERTLSLITTERLAIIDGNFYDERFMSISDETAFISDAVTISHSQLLKTYCSREDRSAFVYTNDLNDIPTGAGIIHGEKIQINNGDDLITLRLVGDDVIYADSGHEFTQTIRARLLALLRRDG